ncbi:MAG: HIRAN domain-containing protein [Coriobacteriia bacterium]|nr:HIRAN domain-containing protein [Coriobacteriia bacterium]
MYEFSRHLLDFCVAGYTYWDATDCQKPLQVGMALDMKVEPDNPYDPRAVALYSQGVHIGYIPSRCNIHVQQLLYFGHDVFTATITSVNPQAPLEQQIHVTIRLEDARDSSQP